MKKLKLAGSVMACGAAIAMTLTVPAGAARTGDAPGGVDVTKVWLVEDGEAAKVAITVNCLPAEQFEIYLEVIQDADPYDGVIDAWYPSTKLTTGTCTGRVQRFTVLTRPEQFSAPDGRLRPGPAYEYISWYLDGVPAGVNTYEVPVR
jgi:hypothetical protein